MDDVSERMIFLCANFVEISFRSSQQMGKEHGEGKQTLRNQTL